jgi:hypothetical protein
VVDVLLISQLLSFTCVSTRFIHFCYYPQQICQELAISVDKCQMHFMQFELSVSTYLLLEATTTIPSSCILDANMVCVRCLHISRAGRLRRCAMVTVFCGPTVRAFFADFMVIVVLIVYFIYCGVGSIVNVVFARIEALITEKSSRTLSLSLPQPSHTYTHTDTHKHTSSFDCA